MARVLVVAEHDGLRLNAATARCVACARAIDGASIDVLVLAADAAPVAAAAARIAGLDRVLTLERAANADGLAAVLAPQVVSVAADYSHVLAPATTFGKDLMPRVAALLGVGQVSDIAGVETAHRFVRPIYAGNALLTIEVPVDDTVVGTVRIASFADPGEDEAAPVVAVAAEVALPEHTRLLGRSAPIGDRPDLQSAQRVVSGGRALGSAENFALIHSLADRLGAAVGASRAAVDAGYVGSDLQVGQTGKIIAPDLYVAVGISGAIQHLTGIRDARTIVAINKDPDAPIFEIADIGLVGDLFACLPELNLALDGAISP